MTNEELINGLYKIKAWAEVAGDVDFWETASSTIRLLEQQPKIGKWQLLNYRNAHVYSCSECGEVGFYATDYCPNCGAKMEVEE